VLIFISTVFENLLSWSNL